MAEGNGFDIGSLYGLMVKIGEAVSRQEVALERLADRMTILEQRVGALDQRVAALDQRFAALEHRVERGFAAMKADTEEIRQTVAGYHASVVGHGIATSELEGRMRRVETHLDLPPFVHG